MAYKKRRSNTEWLAELADQDAHPEALADLREYLLRAVFLYLDRHRQDLASLDRRELEHLAEDFAQEALLQILAKLDTFRGDSKFTTWAYRFVINAAAGELRLRRWRTLSIEALSANQETSRFTLFLEQADAEPETIAERNQILDVLRTIIDKELTERQRFALVNTQFQDVPVISVASLLDTTPNAIYKLVHDARKKIKAGLQRRHYTEGDVLAIFAR